MYTALGLSLGETAESTGIPVAVLADRFRDRGIRVMDAPTGPAMANLARQAKLLGAERLAASAQQVADDVNRS